MAGPSHVLPTFGSARFASALTVDDFRKHLHVITVDEAGFERVAPVVQTLAGVEGFDAHAQSIRLRRARSPGVGAERSRSDDETRMPEAPAGRPRRPEGQAS